jgi:tetratricopeptide (TPR) repeat protein
MKKSLLLLVAIFLFITGYGQTAKEYYEQGKIRIDKSDFKGAISDFTNAIKIDSNYAEAYYNRGQAKTSLRNFHGSIMDYTKAIEITPKKRSCFYNRGLAEQN